MDTYEILNEMGKEIPIGSEGLIALDYFQGNRSPHTDPLVTGIAVELGDRIIELAYRAGPDGDRAVLAEGKLALTRYLETRATKQPE